jgi:hypothetical protein
MASLLHEIHTLIICPARREGRTSIAFYSIVDGLRNADQDQPATEIAQLPRKKDGSIHKTFVKASRTGSTATHPV